MDASGTYAHAHKHTHTLPSTSKATFTYLTVFTTPNLTNHLVVFLITPIDSQGFIIPIITRTMNVDIGVDSVDSDSMLLC